MSGETLKTIDRTLQVLGSFSRSRPELTVAELVRDLNFPRAVVTRIVATLENAHFLERAPGTYRYRIGIAACELGAIYLTGNSLVDSSRDILQDLAQRTGFTVYLGVCHGSDVVILSSCEGRTPIRFIWAVGDRVPITATALGKAILMHLSSREIDQLLGRDALPGLTSASITRRTILDAQLREYASKGWIPAFEESLPGVYAVGAAILTPAGTPIAGISISFLRDSSDATQMEQMGQVVLDAAQALCRRIAPQYAYRALRETTPFTDSRRTEVVGEEPGVPGKRVTVVPDGAPVQTREKL
jgi:IclR family acetate operon transcriptional repressor